MASKAEKKTQEKKAISKEDIVLAALALSVELGWAQVTLADIADKTGLSLAELRTFVDDKTDILVAFGRMIDRRVLKVFDRAEAFGGEDVSSRDRLFDVLMERFDVLNDYRDGVVSILRSFAFDPKQAVISCPHLCRSMVWMLEVSGIESNGLKGAAKVLGLTGLYLKTLKVWSDDESPDMGKTMAALDKDMGRVEWFASRFGL